MFAGPTVVARHFGCETIEACPAAGNAAALLLLAATTGLTPIRTSTVPPFLMFTFDTTFDSGVSGFLNYAGVYEPFKARWLRGVWESECAGVDVASPCSMVDGGANVGFFGLYARALGFNATLIDPQPECARAIRLSLALNGWAEDGRARVVEMGLHDGDGPSALPIMAVQRNVGGSGLADAQYLRKNALNNNEQAAPSGAMARMTTLDSLFAEAAGTIAVLKLDIEGMEAKALLGAARLIGSSRIRHIATDFWKGDYVGRAVALLRGSGFSGVRNLESVPEQWEAWTATGGAAGLGRVEPIIPDAAAFAAAFESGAAPVAEFIFSATHPPLGVGVGCSDDPSTAQLAADSDAVLTSEVTATSAVGEGTSP